MASIFSESFEGTGKPSGWESTATVNWDSTGPGSMAPNGGSQCLRIAVTSDYCFAYFDHVHDDVSYFRAYVYVDSYTCASGEDSNILFLQDENWNAIGGVNIWNDAGTYRWRLALNAGGWQFHPGAAIALDTWTCIEMHLDATAGHAEFWVDGVSQDTVTGLTIDAPHVYGVGFCNNAPTGVIYIDLVKADTTTYIGPESTGSSASTSPSASPSNSPTTSPSRSPSNSPSTSPSSSPSHSPSTSPSNSPSHSPSTSPSNSPTTSPSSSPSSSPSHSPSNSPSTSVSSSPSTSPSSSPSSSLSNSNSASPSSSPSTSPSSSPSHSPSTSPSNSSTTSPSSSPSHSPSSSPSSSISSSPSSSPSRSPSSSPSSSPSHSPSSSPSSSYGPADDVDPASVVRLVFHHHSTGGMLLANTTGSDDYGGLGSHLNDHNYYVSETGYASENTGFAPTGFVDIADYTDVGNWYSWFKGTYAANIMAASYGFGGRTSSYGGPITRTVSDPGGENKIIIIKSCFPNSNVYDDNSTVPADFYEQAVGAQVGGEYVQTLSNCKALYERLFEYMSIHTDKIFVIFTNPPLSSANTTSGRAANARALATWLIDTWLQNNSWLNKNIYVWDYFNVLTDAANHHYVSGGSIAHVIGTATNYLAYPSTDDHPSGVGQRKASSEFVPVLNTFYNRYLDYKASSNSASVSSSPSTSLSSSISTSPSSSVSSSPSSSPSTSPSNSPSTSSSSSPSHSPSTSPSNSPSNSSSTSPSSSPSTSPSNSPTTSPSSSPSSSSSTSPSSSSSTSPSSSPSNSPSTSPSGSPSNSPSTSTSNSPSTSSSTSPSNSPSTSPSGSPSNSPSTSPSNSASTSPSGSPSNSSSTSPSNSPSATPSSSPSNSPSTSPSNSPSRSPSSSPSNSPSTSISSSPSSSISHSPSAAPPFGGLHGRYWNRYRY